MQLLAALFDVYASRGYGPQPTSPTLTVLAPDALSQAILASMTLGAPSDMIKTAPVNIPDPTKVNAPRPLSLPPTAPWPPIVTVDIFYLTTYGISFFESVPDPSNPPLFP